MYYVGEILIKIPNIIKLKMFKYILRKENENNEIAENTTKFNIILKEQKLRTLT